MCALIVPWNYPMLMAAQKVAPALATGCTVVLKPAEQTPLTALELARAAADAGLPAGVLNVLPGFGESAGGALVNHPDVDKIAFTGSTAVGRVIMKSAADTLKRVSLELGGKSPNIVFADADLDAAAAAAPMAVFGNAGQDCCARSRILVERPELADRVADDFSQCGNPRYPEDCPAGVESGSHQRPGGDQRRFGHFQGATSRSPGS